MRDVGPAGLDDAVAQGHLDAAAPQLRVHRRPLLGEHGGAGAEDEVPVPGADFTVQEAFLDAVPLLAVPHAPPLLQARHLVGVAGAVPVEGVPGRAVGEAQVGAAGQAVQDGSFRRAGAAGVHAVVDPPRPVVLVVQVGPDLPLLVRGQVVLLAGRLGVDDHDVDVLGPLPREGAERDVLVHDVGVRARQQPRRVHLRHPAAVGDLHAEQGRGVRRRREVGEQHRAVQALDGERPQIAVAVVGLDQLVQVLLQIGGRLPAGAVLRRRDDREHVVVVVVFGCRVHGRMLASVLG